MAVSTVFLIAFSGTKDPFATRVSFWFEKLPATIASCFFYKPLKVRSVLHGEMFVKVFTAICKGKIFDSIVRFITILVMNKFRGFKWASKMFRHYKAMLHNVTLRVAHGIKLMILGNQEIHIPVRAYVAPSLVGVTFLACPTKIVHTCTSALSFSLHCFVLYRCMIGVACIIPPSAIGGEL